MMVSSSLKTSQISHSNLFESHFILLGNITIKKKVMMEFPISF